MPPGQLPPQSATWSAAAKRQWLRLDRFLTSIGDRALTPAEDARLEGMMAALRAEIASPTKPAPGPVARRRMTAAEARAEIAASERAARQSPPADRAFTPSGRASLALHEAGHALAYLVAGRGLQAVSIAPAATYFTGGAGPAWCVTAGPMAAVLAGFETQCGARYSEDDLARLRAALAAAPGQTKASAEADAVEVLRRGWAGVQALAAVLVRCGTVGGADAVRIIAHANAVAAEGGTYFRGHATFSGLYAA